MTVLSAIDSGGVKAQEPADSQALLPQAKLLLSEWGFFSASEIRLGQLSLIHDSAGPRLAVYRLSADAPPAFPDRPVGWTPATEDGVLSVADFSAGSRNALGGYFGVFERPPAAAATTVEPAPDGRRALRLSYRNEAGGFAGLWVHLFDYTLPPAERRYLDARSFSSLGFWIRGGRGGRRGARLQIKLADAAWEMRGDALPLGDVADFLPEGTLLTTWQWARVPLSLIPARVDRSLLASVVLEAVGEGAGEVYITGLGFSVGDEAAPALPAPTASPAARPRSLGQAAWVWNTAEILDDPHQRARLLDLLTAHGFDRVFLQLVDAEKAGKPVGLLDPDPRLRRLVAALRRWGIRVYALDGFKDYALPAHHASVLATVDNVIRFNEESLPAERFAGIHHDIEPYLLPGFNGAQRETLARAYLELVAACARRVREAGLEYEVDIPFWYDAPADYTFEPVDVEFGGVRKPLSQHLIDLTDGVALMDYRTTAFGADGTIRHAEGELEYAAARGKRVLIGLETSPLPDEDLFDFVGAPQTGPPDATALEGGLVAATSLGDSTAFLVIPAADGRGLDWDSLSARLAERGLDPGNLVWWRIHRRLRVPGDRLSFHRLGAEALERVMGATAAELSSYPSFSGFALHHAWSYGDLLERRPRN